MAEQTVNELEHGSGGRVDPALESLEQRLHRLENAVASLQDTRALEERVSERVRQRLQTATPVAPNHDDKIVDSKRHPLPLAAEPEAANRTAQLATLATAAAILYPRQRWLFIDVWAELLTIFRMFFDVRYHVGWFARLAVLVLLPAIFFSGLLLWWVPIPPFLGLNVIFFKLVDLLLAFFLYKTLSREVRRYREWRAQTRRR